MSKQLITEDVLESPEGIEVMGMNPDGHLFYGATTGDLHHNESKELAGMSIKGHLLCDGRVIPFNNEPVSLSDLRHLDDNIFSKLYLFALNKSSAIRQGKDGLVRVQMVSEKMEQLLN